MATLTHLDLLIVLLLRFLALSRVRLGSRRRLGGLSRLCSRHLRPTTHTNDCGYTPMSQPPHTCSQPQQLHQLQHWDRIVAASVKR
jgi:hypothetical protein